MKALLIAFTLSAHLADAETTRRGIQHGLVEANPAMHWVTATPARIYVVKSAVAVSQIAVFEHWRKKHPKLAPVVCLAIDGAVLGVAAHNVKLLRGK